MDSFQKIVQIDICLVPWLLSCDILQSSSVSFLLFCIYMKLLAEVIQILEVDFHHYVDAVQFHGQIHTNISHCYKGIAWLLVVNWCKFQSHCCVVWQTTQHTADKI